MPSENKPRPLREEAYYFGFCFTGQLLVDTILSDIAYAGKHYHHTDQWDEDEIGPIQQSAVNAAEHITTLTAERDKLREALVRAEWASPSQYSSDERRYCPCCGGEDPEVAGETLGGHNEGCDLAAALAETLKGKQ